VGYCLGIDLGTTFTAAAIIRDGRPEMAVLGSRTAAVPTVIFVADDQTEILVGEAARRRVATDPGRVAREFKRRLGDATPIFLGETPRSPESLLALVLRWVVDQVTEQEGGPPERVVVTHPANWGAYRKELLDHAIRQTDVANVSTITEPEAAAVYYASTERIEPGELIAVYDLGGGTFDAALLRKTPTGFELVGSPEGIEHLGGIDVDEAIFEHVRRSLGGMLEGLDPDDPATVRALHRLREECNEAKEALSFDARATVPVLLPGVQSEVVITRAELEPMIRPLLNDTIAALRRAFATAGVEPAQVRAVLLVGGSSRIPLVGEMITAELGRPVAVDAHPKHAIALGAALTAGGNLDGAAGAATAAAAALPEPGESDATWASGTDAATEAPPRFGEPVPDESARAGGRPKWLVPAIAGAVVVVALVAFLLTQGGDGDGGQVATDATTTTAASETTTSVPVDAAFEVPEGPPLDENTIAFTRVDASTWNVWTVDAADGTQVAQLTNEVAVRAMLPAMAPNRRSIAYTVADGATWQLAITDSNGDGDLMIVDDLAPDSRATWSPDGTRLAYVSDQGGTKDLFVLDLVTGEETQLTDTPAEEGDPAWSPDGDQIAYWARLAGNQDIYVVGVGGGTETRLTDDPGDDADPAWRPDGSEIAFASMRTGDWEIWIMADDGSEQRQLTAVAGPDQDPAFSPDGASIAFESKRDSPERDDFSELYVMLADGTEARRLTNLEGFDAHPSWGVPG
jgi:molecular chaperone DnaK